jgi:hypothetical protein
VHEFGHFWVAKRLGFKVLRFSVGFWKPLWRRVGADGTEYIIAAVPLGGYVKMLDEREGSGPPAELPSRAFNRRPHWQRIAVLLAGPAFNIIFAMLVLTGILLMSGVVQVRPVIGDIEADTVAGRAGLRSGDEIVAIDGRAVNSQRDVLLDLLDAVSDNAPITLAARAADGALRPDHARDSRSGRASPAHRTFGAHERPGIEVLRAADPGRAGRGRARWSGSARRTQGRGYDRLRSTASRCMTSWTWSRASRRIRASSVSIRYRRDGLEATVQVPVLAESARWQDGRAHSRQAAPSGAVSGEHAAAHSPVAAGRVRARQRRGLGHDRAAGHGCSGAC